MPPRKLSAGKRLAKPLVLGTLFVGLATAFVYRHNFFPDVPELRAEQQVRNRVKILEVMEMRQRQMEELIDKKKNN